jgi:hypothetical protein
MALVHERTIPTELLPTVGEISAKFFRQRVSRGQCGRSLQPYSQFLDRSRYFSFQVVLISTHEDEWTLFQTQYSENLAVLGIEARPLDQ